MGIEPEIQYNEDEKTSQNIEIILLLEAIYMKYGYDFRNYSKAHVKRRIMSRMARSNFASISELQHKVLNDAEIFHTLLLDLSLNITEMFRDPKFFLLVRDIIVPILKTYPFFKIWHAGCSSGEEVYSMAILLKEEGILDRCIIYATDFNQIVLKKASEGIYPVDKLKEYSENYNKANGKISISDYFTTSYNAAIFDKNLKKNIVFSDHNLVTDGVFGEMNMIVCRNVLIYFNRELQDRVIQLFSDSLVPGGLLCLGPKETLVFSNYKENFEMLHKLNIFKKKYK